MQQHMAALDAERADDQVDCFADRDAVGAKAAVIGGRGDSQIGVEESDRRKLQQCFLELPRDPIVSGTLQNFQQNEVADQKLVLVD